MRKIQSFFAGCLDFGREAFFVTNTISFVLHAFPFTFAALNVFHVQSRPSPEFACTQWGHTATYDRLLVHAVVLIFAIVVVKCFFS